MDDYLTEHEQWEALKAWLRENGIWIIAGIAVGALGLLGWNWWNARLDRLAVEASSKYEQILEAFDRNDRTRAHTLIDELARDYSGSPYVDQANLAAARAAVQAGDFSDAAARLTKVMQESDDRELALVARLRLARLQIAQQKPDEAIATLNGVPDPGAFAPRFHEVRGDALYAKGDKAGALKEYLAARAGTSIGSVDAQLLELKINDLEGEGTASPDESAPKATGDSAPTE